MYFGKQQQQQAADRSILFVLTPLLEIVIPVAQDDRRAIVHHLKQVSCNFEPSSSWPIYCRKWLNSARGSSKSAPKFRIHLARGCEIKGGRNDTLGFLGGIRVLKT